MCKRRVNTGFQLKFDKGVIAINQLLQQIGSGRTVLKFGELPNLNPKRRRFSYILNKKGVGPDDASSSHYSLSPLFFSKKLV